MGQQVSQHYRPERLGVLGVGELVFEAFKISILAVNLRHVIDINVQCQLDTKIGINVPQYERRQLSKLRENRFFQTIENMYEVKNSYFIQIKGR